MNVEIRCYNCGESLQALSLPISRRDMCPSCSLHLHVCRMCMHYDPKVLRQCREDEAEEVLDKRKVNFCEWFSVSGQAWDGSSRTGEQRARAELDALFGDGETAAGDDDTLTEAEKLFRD